MLYRDEVIGGAIAIVSLALFFWIGVKFEIFGSKIEFNARILIHFLLLITAFYGGVLLIATRIQKKRSLNFNPYQVALLSVAVALFFLSGALLLGFLAGNYE